MASKRSNRSSTRSSQSRSGSYRKNRASTDFLQFERLRTAEAYFQVLQASNQKSLQYFQDTIRHTYFASIASMILYILTYLVALVALSVGLYKLFDAPGGNPLSASSSILVGIIMLIALFMRDPLRNTHGLLNHLARLNVVFTGYIRQIHQVDATFRGLFLATDDPSLADMEEMLARIQLAVDNALEGINQVLEEVNN